MVDIPLPAGHATERSTRSEFWRDCAIPTVVTAQNMIDWHAVAASVFVDLRKCTLAGSWLRAVCFSSSNGGFERYSGRNRDLAAAVPSGSSNPVLEREGKAWHRAL